MPPPPGGHRPTLALVVSLIFRRTQGLILKAAPNAASSAPSRSSLLISYPVSSQQTRELQARFSCSVHRTTYGPSRMMSMPNTESSSALCGVGVATHTVASRGMARPSSEKISTALSLEYAADPPIPCPSYTASNWPKGINSERAALGCIQVKSAPVSTRN